MNNTYKFGGGQESKVFGPLKAGDYSFVVANLSGPYKKDNGNWVLSVRLAIQPGGETVFANPWSGTDKNGEHRDGIGEFLLAVNRAPAKGAEPDWSKVAGARGKCRLKVEKAEQGALAGKEVNRVDWFYRPKELEEPKRAGAGVIKPDPTDDLNMGKEPDEIPF